MLDDFDLSQLQGFDDARQWVVRLLNVVEEQAQRNLELEAELVRLQNEVNRLKGEQGKPDVKPKRKPTDNKRATDHSSEQERRQPKEHRKGSKRDKLKIDETRALAVDKALLPADAVFKGYEEVTVQDLRISTHNILFRKEKYYSPSLGKTYLADLPPGYGNEFGPGVRGWLPVCCYGLNMTQPNLLELLRHAGLHISAGQISNFLSKDQERFHDEKAAVFEAGLRSSPWHHIDDTSTRVNGQNRICDILCNPLYTAYFTVDSKTRLTVLDVLTNFRERTFLLTDETYQHLEVFRLPQKVVEQLYGLPQEQELSEATFCQLLAEALPNLGPKQQTHVLEAAAIAAYHAQLEFPVILSLVCDDAPQFKLLTAELSLCWVHEGRHYKKLCPCLRCHQQLVDTFLGSFWDYYSRLLAYKENPTAETRSKLEQDFDELFATVTGYDQLDERIAKTKAKKGALLLVLEHPELPVHNNPAELGARKRVRKRVVSFGPRSEEGVQAWDTFMTLIETAKKLGVSCFDYFHDRLSETYAMPSLADLINQRAQELNLGASWDHAP